MIRNGDPEVLTPDLFATMTKFEQTQIRNYFGRRLDEEGRGFSNRPDDEAPTVVARRAYLQGTWVVYLLRSAPFIIVGPILLSLLTAGEHDAVTIGGLAVCVSGCAFFMAQWGNRVKQIRCYFATFEAGGWKADVADAASGGSSGRDARGISEHYAHHPPRITAMERGRIIGSLSGVVTVWSLWLAFGFALSVPIATTFVLLAAMAAAQFLRRSRRGPRRPQ